MQNRSCTEVRTVNKVRQQSSIYYLELLKVLTSKELKVRYKNSILGYFWSIGNPLVLAFIFLFAFKEVMRVPIENYALFLICGLFPWQMLSNSILNTLNIYSLNSTIIKKVRFPRYVLVLSSVFMELIHLIVSIPVIYIFMHYYGLDVSWAWVFGLPLWLLVYGIFVSALSVIFSSINVFLRDTERFVSLFLIFLFYLSPVLYSSELVPETFKELYMVNPMVYFIEGWRGIFLTGVMRWDLFGICVLISTPFVVLAVLINRWLSPKFSEVV